MSRAARMSVAGGPHAPPPRQQRDLVVVGGSAGGVEALATLMTGLPPELPAAVLVVLHVAASGHSALPEILARAGPLPVRYADDDRVLRRGEVVVARPDQHLLVHDGHVRLSRGPRENGHRPAIDPLFRSAARAGGRRTIAVLLSGMLDDGVAGLALVRERGGVCMVQDPDDAGHGEMPAAAIEAGLADVRLPVAAMGAALGRLLDADLGVAEPGAAGPVATAGPSAPEDLDRVEIDVVAHDVVAGGATGLTCPDCGGALWEQDGGVVRFVCHVGHAFSRASMLEHQGRALDVTLWSALRALEERADLLRRVARRSSGLSRDRLMARAADSDDHAGALRAILLRAGAEPVAPGTVENEGER